MFSEIKGLKTTYICSAFSGYFLYVADRLCIFATESFPVYALQHAGYSRHFLFKMISQEGQ